MESGDMDDIVDVLLQDALGENPQNGQHISHSQFVESPSGGDNEYTALEAVPYIYEQPEMISPSQAAYDVCKQPQYDHCSQSYEHLYGHAGQYCQGQYLPYHPAYDYPGVASTPPHPYMSPMVFLQDQEITIPLFGNGNEEELFGFPAGRTSTPPAPAAPKTSISRKRNTKSQKGSKGPYIKKPPNAFMIFAKEQRPKLIFKMNADSASVNAILGKTWRSMSEREQAKYYKQANKERQRHAEMFPEWSSSENYGKKRKRERRKGALWNRDYEYEAGEDT